MGRQYSCEREWELSPDLPVLHSVIFQWVNPICVCVVGCSVGPSDVNSGHDLLIDTCFKPKRTGFSVAASNTAAAVVTFFQLHWQMAFTAFSDGKLQMAMKCCFEFGECSLSRRDYERPISTVVFFKKCKMEKNPTICVKNKEITRRHVLANEQWLEIHTIVTTRSCQSNK